MKSVSKININSILSRIDDKYIESVLSVDSVKKQKEINKIESKKNKNDIVKGINDLAIGDFNRKFF